MEKLYKAVRQKFDESFKSPVTRATLEFTDNKIYFMKNMEVSVECNGEYCIIKSQHGRLDLYIKDFDFEKQVNAVTSSIFIIIDIISTATEVSLSMLTAGAALGSIFSSIFDKDVKSDKKEKEILN